MQATSLLEARRLTWKQCSTSKAICIAQGLGLKTAVQRPALVPLLTRQRQSGQRRVRLPTSQFRCQSQAQDTKERQAEETNSQNGYFTNGNSSNGSQSNGKGSNGSTSNGSSPQSYETDSTQESLGSGGSTKGNKGSSETKGTLDHLLESSRQVRSGTGTPS